MSVWYKVKDKDDVRISDDGKTLEVNFDAKYDGNIYVEIPLEFIKELVIKHPYFTSEKDIKKP